MTDPQQARVGNAERAAATDALGQQQRDGRLSADEYAERSTKAASAVTRADLDALFVDLPAGAGRAPSPAAPSVAQTAAAPVAAAAPAAAAVPAVPAAPAAAPVTAAPVTDRRQGAMRWLYFAWPLATLLYVIVGLAFHGWGWGWVFFLIPAALGAVMYGGGSFGATSEAHAERDAYRAQRRDARRNR